MELKSLKNTITTGHNTSVDKDSILKKKKQTGIWKNGDLKLKTQLNYHQRSLLITISRIVKRRNIAMKKIIIKNPPDVPQLQPANNQLKNY
ncbi:hypothetical protein Glove_212g10 [Diversispora epigaea]|uniref:Uncharacterized protein n=1 Tax=Diversispora epigaea TaxID=1348612 RepID=A0A397ISI0_9GLOM|nr:hypothetical protein Glove_212g10 [Diversispora epigaea]